MLDLGSLNEAQREAVMHGEGALLVLAGPGSGKTYTITQRIFYLLERENVKPENILVITFTKDAALSMQNRFQQLSPQILPVNFGTFHSVFYHILRESHILNPNQLLTEAQKRKLITPILKEYLEERQYGQNNLSEDAVSLLAAISYFKNTESYEEAENKLSEEWKPHFRIILKQYEKERKRIGAYDFDDMVYECRKALSNNRNLRKYWQGRFRHILMDEFQDISPVQYEVIRLLMAEPVNLFAVGDDDQAIYGFRGSKPACLKRFAQDYQAKQICLNLNYRSRPEIIRASLTVIGENKDRFFKELKASPDKETLPYNRKETVVIKAFEEREQQYHYLISKLSEHTYSEKGSEKKIGILFRTNAYMQGVAARLGREGIAYVMKERVTSIYEHFAIRDIMAYLRLAAGKKDRALFLQVMNKPSRYISREALGNSEELPDYSEICDYYRHKELNPRGMEVIHRIQKWEKQMEHLKKLSPFLAVQYIRRVIGYDTYLKERAGGKKEQRQEWEELLNWLGTDAAGYETVSEWMEVQEAYTKAVEQGGSKVQGKGAFFAGDGKSQAISLMTVHAAKGLEFDKVYIPDCNEKIFPHGNMPDGETCEEERRIFYVAMTRAKESLELLYLTGTKERPRLPSRFLNKLFPAYSSTSSSNSQLSRYSSKASATFSYSSSSSINSSSGSSLGSSGFS